VVAENNNDRSSRIALPKSVSIGAPLADTSTFNYKQAVLARAVEY
jgi:hypothetical protein